MTYNLFIDDERFPPNDGRTWVIARNMEQVVDYVNNNGQPSYVSFDHDLGDDIPTGFDIAKFLVDCDLDGVKFPVEFDFYVHSQNPVGRDNINNYLNQYLKVRDL